MNEEVTPDVPVMQIDGVTYAMSDINPAQHELVAQIKDLEDQLRVNEFKHDQLIRARTAFITDLKTSLEAPDGSQPE